MAVLKKKHAVLGPNVQKAPHHLTVEHVPIDSVRCHPKNPVIHNVDNLNTIKRSLQDFGQRKSIAVWNGYIVAGNGTWTAAKALGWKTIAISRCDHLTESQAESYLLADNKASDGHAYDEELTATLVRSIQSRGDIDLESTGMSTYELEPLLNADLPNTPDYLEGLEGSGLEGSDISGNSSAMRRLIIAYDTDAEMSAICNALGIEHRDGKNVYTVEDCAFLQTEDSHDPYVHIGE